MKNAPPARWQAHDASGYDEAMAQKGETLLKKIMNDPAYRIEIRTDPRALHKFLFEQFAPADYLEYAGTYRGTPNTSLAGRVAVTKSLLNDGEVYNFCAPNEVAKEMALLSNIVTEHVANSHSDEHRRAALAFQFATLGRIHPFLDGTGHVQRVLFAALATEFGYSLSKKFVIHPRPFDRLFGIALELFTKEPKDTRNEQLGLVIEYLNFFIE